MTKLKAIKPVSASAVNVTLGEPVVVSMAAVEEVTWGYWQFPTISRLPGGDLLLTVNNTQDDDLCYGHSGPAWLSHDEGHTWHAADLDEKALSVSHSPVCELFDGVYVCVPMPFGKRPGSLPKEVYAEPVGRFYSYIWRSLHRLSRFPHEIQDYFTHLHGSRWSPKTQRWEHVRVKWDVRDALLRVDEEGMVGAALSCTSLEYRPVKLGRELLHSDYRMSYLHADGASPKTWEVWCFASRDNGRTWQRRGRIAHHPDGDGGPTESNLCVTSRGDLVCVSRTTDHRQLPMMATYSKDAGRTWSEPVTLFDYGVLPTLITLNNGVMALSFGRPGVSLSFSPRGDGRTWTKPVEVLPKGLPKKRGGGTWKWEELLHAGEAGRDVQKDGYTSMLAIHDDTFLITYTDQAHVDSRGRKRKALIVRPITVKPR